MSMSAILAGFTVQNAFTCLQSPLLLEQSGTRKQSVSEISEFI
jgi:hypothetical protein